MARKRSRGLHTLTSRSISHPCRFAPACSNWVDRLDPDEWCQSSSSFTGCVIVEGNEFVSSVFSSDNEVLIGYRVNLDPADTQTLSESDCQNTFYATMYNVWEHNAETNECNWYNQTDAWSRYLVPSDVVGGITTVGTFGPGSGGYLVPNQHAGPTVDTYPYTAANVYEITTIRFFVNDKNFLGCPNTSEYSTVEGLIQYEGIINDDDEVEAHTYDLTAGISADNISVECLSQASVAALYPQSDWSNSNRAPFMIVLTLDPNASLRVVGSPLQPTTTGASYTAPRNFQMVFRGPDFDLAGPQYVPNVGRTAQSSLLVSTIIPGASQASIYYTRYVRRTCVPLTLRRVVTAQSLETDSQQYIVRRTDPVNCATMGADPNDVNKAMFGEGGCCSSDQQLEWPSTTVNQQPQDHGADINLQCKNRQDVGLVTNLRTFSRWFWALSWGSVGDGRILMMDSSVTTPQLDIGSTNIADLLAISPAWTHEAPPVGSLPTCGASSEMSSCRIAIDQTGYVPCTGSQDSVWFSCMNPLMTAYFPQ